MSTIHEIDYAELSALIIRIEEAIAHDLSLSVEDMKLLLTAITTLCTLQAKIEQDDITLHKLRKLLGMIKQSEKRKASTSGRKKGEKKKSVKPKNTNKKNNMAPKVVHHQLEGHHKGETCEACARGKLYKFEPATLLRITGHARYEATRHIVEQLRCNACQKVYKASLPETVLEDGDADQEYGYSARSMMVIDKFYTGVPYYHQGNLAMLFGHAVVASTIFDQCEYVANDVMPIFYELKRQAANAARFLIDDTRHRILEQAPELRDRPNGKGQQLRSGVYCSGLIATLASGDEIVLFETSLGHAGEHLASILEKRSKDLAPPLVMSDALSSNSVIKTEFIACYCNAHARRQFYDLEHAYPKDIGWVLETYGKIWENDAHVQEKKLDDKARLAYHKEHSLPVMQNLKAWAIARTEMKSFEEHSTYGKAINYYLNHYDKLIQFCLVEGAPIDNNKMEEKLKIPIRGRKSSHFYKTVNGAGVANVLISLIATTTQAEENVYEYLCALQRNREKVKDNPTAWLPWHYRQTLAKNTQDHTELIKT